MSSEVSELVPYAGQEVSRASVATLRLRNQSLSAQNKLLTQQLNAALAEQHILVSNLRRAQAEIAMFEHKFVLLGRTLKVAQAHFPQAQEPKIRRMTTDDVVSVVAKYYRISIADLKGSSRHRSVMVPRLVAAFLAREFTGESDTSIGNCLGGRDHATVIHAFRRIQKIRPANQEIDEAIVIISKELRIRFGEAEGKKKA